MAGKLEDFFIAIINGDTSWMGHFVVQIDVVS